MPSPYTVDHYLHDLRAIRNTGSATAETSFYPPVDRLFNAAGESLKPRVLFSTQLRNQGAGMPDGGFFPQPARNSRNTAPPPLTNPERGVVEIKPAGYSLDTLTNEPQPAATSGSTASSSSPTSTSFASSASIPTARRAPSRNTSLPAPRTTSGTAPSTPSTPIYSPTSSSASCSIGSRSPNPKT